MNILVLPKEYLLRLPYFHKHHLKFSLHHLVLMSSPTLKLWEKVYVLYLLEQVKRLLEVWMLVEVEMAKWEMILKSRVHYVMVW